MTRVLRPLRVTRLGGSSSPVAANETCIFLPCSDVCVYYIYMFFSIDPVSIAWRMYVHVCTCIYIYIYIYIYMYVCVRMCTYIRHNILYMDYNVLYMDVGTIFVCVYCFNWSTSSRCPSRFHTHLGIDPTLIRLNILTFISVHLHFRCTRRAVVSMR